MDIEVSIQYLYTSKVYVHDQGESYRKVEKNARRLSFIFVEKIVAFIRKAYRFIMEKCILLSV